VRPERHNNRSTAPARRYKSIDYARKIVPPEYARQKITKPTALPPGLQIDEVSDTHFVSTLMDGERLHTLQRLPIFRAEIHARLHQP
jgi:hypothetical protein